MNEKTNIENRYNKSGHMNNSRYKWNLNYSRETLEMNEVIVNY